MTIGIFVAGVLVTLVVSFALVIVIWGAIMDGRDQPAGYATGQQRAGVDSAERASPKVG